MSSRQFVRNFYFYFSVKSRQIKKQVTEKDSAEGRDLRKKLRFFLKTAGKAAVVSILLYEVFFYLHMGRLLLPNEYFKTWLLQLETILSFIYIFFILLIFPLISQLVNNRLRHVQPFFKILIEILLVVVINAVLLSLINIAPLLLFYPEVEPPADRFRTSYMVTGIFSLFFYFFVERERGKKRLQAEMLLSARLQKENYQAQLENLKDQVNPHFLFNSLNVLVSLIPQDPDRAVEFTQKLSELYRSFLDNSSQQLIPLKKELEIAEAYIYLLQTRFGDAVKFELDISPEASLLHLPPGSLQVLLENAIKHNGSTRKKPLLVEISAYNENLVVKNNLQPRVEHVNSTETGLKNIESRYSFLSDKKPEFIKTEDHFIAKLPLLKVEDL